MQVYFQLTPDHAHTSHLEASLQWAASQRETFHGVWRPPHMKCSVNLKELQQKRVIDDVMVRLVITSHSSITSIYNTNMYYMPDTIVILWYYWHFVSSHSFCFYPTFSFLFPWFFRFFFVIFYCNMTFSDLKHFHFLFGKCVFIVVGIIGVIWRTIILTLNWSVTAAADVWQFLPSLFVPAGPLAPPLSHFSRFFPSTHPLLSLPLLSYPPVFSWFPVQCCPLQDTQSRCS